MFRGCVSLTILNISNFDTRNVTNMFYMFSDCKTLKSLDLTSFNTSKVTNMASMFGYCSSLKTIYISNIWSITSVTNGDSMFYDCTSLVGAVPFDKTKTDISMANYTTGYLTYKSNN